MLKKLQKVLEEKKLGGLFIENKTNLRYLTSFTGSSGSLLILAQKIYFFADGRYLLEAKRTLKPLKLEVVGFSKTNFKEIWREILKKHRVKKLGFEEEHLTVAQFKNLRKISREVKLKGTKGIVEDLRAIKNELEIRKIKKAQEITDRIFHKLKKIIKVGQAEAELAFLIQVLAHEFGAEDLAFPPVVAFSSASACPHHQVSSRRKLKKGDLILLDLGVKYHGYCSDLTRVLFTHPPTPLQEKIYHLVLKTQEVILKKLKPGLTGHQLFSLAQKTFDQKGCAKNFLHGLGHGVGLLIHEKPSLAEKARDQLQENMVLTIEPGIYLPGKFGIRIEDLVLIKKNRIINLTQSPKQIKDCILT